MKDNRQKHRFAFALAYGALLAGFTGYVMLDTFVIPTAKDTSAGEINYSLFEDIEQKPLEITADSQNEIVTESQPESSHADTETKQEQINTKSSGRTSTGKHSRRTQEDESSSADPSSEEKAETTVSGSSAYEPYSDENISITMNEYYQNSTKIYVADIRLSSAQYLKTAFADSTYGKNVTAKTSVTARENNAVLAINGDYYGAREQGYVIRNGVLYRSSAAANTEVLCIYADGHMEIINSSDKTAEQLIEEGVWQAFTFGPGLLIDGETAVSEGEEVGRAKASNPRTAVGMIDELHYVFVVSDGRTDESEGLSLSQLAEFMKSLGVQQAYNLDGGGSSTLYYNGEVINNPTTSGSSIKERSVSDIVYIGY